MASFKAENIETDDESDDELDDTKEIQIEEALKVYQTAVKLQSQGEDSLKETQEAYKTLFESEVFKYPESLSEYNRVELYGDQIYDDQLFFDGPAPPAIVPTAVVENAPSTLPQVLHLSYKNRGQLHLDILKASLKSNPDKKAVYDASIDALSDFTEALDKDIDDVDLWRKISKISQAFECQRISRYCLETILEGDEQGTDETLGELGMEMKLADHELNQVIQGLEDDVWRTSGPPTTNASWNFWQKRLALFPYLPDVSRNGPLYNESSIEISTESTWSAVGSAILDRLKAEQEGKTNSSPTAPWKIILPNVVEATEIVKSSTPDVQDVTMSPVILPDGEASTEAQVTVSNEAEEKQADSLPSNDLVSEPLELTESTTVEDLPIRKRSSEAAELPEEPEGGRIRSKRLRARESLAVESHQSESATNNNTSAFDQKIQASSEADEALFAALNAIVEKIGLDRISPAKVYRGLITSNAETPVVGGSTEVPLQTAILDFYATMQTWSAAKNEKLLMSGKSTNSFDDARQIGLSSYLEQANYKNQKTPLEDFNTNLGEFVQSINESQLCTSQVAFAWVFSLLRTRQDYRLGRSSYTLEVWPSDLKDTVLQVIMKLDEFLYGRVNGSFSEISTAVAKSSNEEECVEFTEADGMLLDLAQSLFELNLDNYTTIADSSSEDLDQNKLHQRVKLNKWASLSRDILCLYSDFRFKIPSAVRLDLPSLRLRHLWASIYHLKVLDEVKRDHLILCIEGLKNEVPEYSSGPIDLPNSSTMPELSSSAADAEISKLETMDFFLGIFEKEGQASVDLIESLEPLLEQSIRSEPANTDSREEEGHQKPRSTFQILALFIQRAGAQLRLSLWHRLLEAYENIEYPPKIFSIHLRSIQVIMEELKSSDYINKEKEDREETLLGFIHELSNALVKAVNLFREDSTVFECLDVDHIRASIKAVTDLWLLLYAVALFDDYSQAGGKGGPSVNPFRTYPLGTFHTASVKLHDMQIQTSVLLYKLICEATQQMEDDFTCPNEMKLECLRQMHYQFGIRRICKAFDSFFLHFMKDELLGIADLQGQSSTDLAQVLYDLYDLHCFTSPADRQNHGCDADYLDRKVAMQIIDFIMEKASKMSIKELLKSDLGKSIEKLHGTLGMVKSNLAAVRNRKFYSDYLNSPILPLDLFRCLQGVTDISTVSISPEEAQIASKGWYFLKGQIALAKYRAQRAKNAAGSEEDLEDAIGFFTQDLELSSERWETWYRMAQAHDYMLEERILWSAEKLNNEQDELGKLQRATIHAYLMATAVANRSAEISPELFEKLSDLYTDFAVCMYSATREPFKMRAFSLRDFPQRHFSNTEATGDPYAKQAYATFPRGKAWKFAVALLKKATRYKPNNWVNHFMLGKCLWKIHTRSDRMEESRFAVQRAFLRAIEKLPERKDPNRQEPVLEPIYKVISITHKLVKRGEIEASNGAKQIEEMLHTQKQIDISKRPNFADYSSWAIYMIDLLKMLRAADKPRWHHRLVLRAARLMHEYGAEQAGGAKAAKDYLVDQHIYSTKTYAISIWKPDNERPGRHWVYMKQYAMFLSSLLDETDDVEGIQLLAKRLRKKPNDYFEHTEVWEDIFSRHIVVHRRYGVIANESSEHIFRGLDQEEFQKRADLIDLWINAPNNTHRLYEVIRETSEIKKLNAGLVKSASIDDLLADTYAEIWSHMGPSTETLPKSMREATPIPAPGAEPPEPAQTIEPAPEIPQDSPLKDGHRNVMSLTNLMNLDGSSDMRGSPAPTPTPSQPDQTVPKNRTRLVSKREIVKRANEATMNKPAAKARTPSPTINKDLLRTPSNTSIIKVVIDKKPSQEPSASAEAGSAVGSLHDSADDESDLTDLEVEDEEEDPGEDDEQETNVVVIKPMFPNLRSLSPDVESSQGVEDNKSEQGNEDRNENEPEDDIHSKEDQEKADTASVSFEDAKEAPNHSDVDKMDVD